MISKVLTVLERGLNIMRLNSRFMLVGILLFVFPLLFIWVTQSFFDTSYTNIESSEKNSIGMLHSLLGTMLINEQSGAVVSDVISSMITEDAGITKIHIVEKNPEGFKIIHAHDPAIIGQFEKNDELYKRLPLSSQDSASIVLVTIDGVRTWQVFKSITLKDRQLYTFSEHSFATIDSLMSSRRLQSYLVLSFIFIFLIALAYWLNRQISWEKHHSDLSNQMKERDLFSNMIAHEFRTPLTAIKGYSSFLQESTTISPEELRFVGNIRSSAERLVVLVNDFLEVSRLQSGQLSIDESETNVGLVLQQVVEDLSAMATEKNLKLIYTNSDSAAVLVTDKSRLTQIFTNLISNAIKYTEEGSVEVAIENARNGVVVRIKDTGMGISAADQKKIFTPFTRVGGVDQTNITGTGLGMWITQQLVTLLNGSLGVESIKGVGTHIVLNFKNK